MSMVLWAYVRVRGQALSDGTDRLALYRHRNRLDVLSRRLELPPFLSACDTTDLHYNTSDQALPEGLSSTDEVMARSGQWLPMGQALALLEGLLIHVENQRPRLGLLRNDREAVATELREVLAFVRSWVQEADAFNFAVVM